MFQVRILSSKLFVIVTVASLSFLTFQVSIATAQNIRSSLFKDADRTLKKAKKARARLLAPKNFSEGKRYYHEAEVDYRREKNLEDIRKKLRASVQYLEKATEATKLAEVTFTATLEARSDAEIVEASNFAAELWLEAEEKFREGARKLEDGNVNSAKSKASEAEKIYRQSELNAVKVNYLQETWELLKYAKEIKVKDQAPKTLKRSQQLIEQAEKELHSNRYDTDVARSLAQQSKYEARHALYLFKVFTQMKESKQGIEDLMLAAEKPLRQIAEKFDIVAEFDSGFGGTTSQIIQYITSYQDRILRLTQDLAEGNQQIADLQERVGEMEQKIGVNEQEKSALAKRIEAQARLRAKFAEVEQTFHREEARVMREVNDIIIRLVGLNFRIGKSNIEPHHFGLLTKVLRVFKIFPGCTVSVKGHTDSYGNDKANLELSKNRAEAVRQYILANSEINTSDIEALGFGESKPIANNETADGRTRNRRIEVVIHPNLANNL